METGIKDKSMRTIFLRIIGISLIPLLVMGIAIILLENIYFRNILREEIKRELHTSAHGLSESYRLADPGDFRVDGDGTVYKGGEKVSGLLHEIDDELYDMGLVCTFFYGDTRIDTTLEDENGNNMAGTKLDGEIYDELCNTAKELFCDETRIGGRSYFGYYIPYKNSDGRVSAIFFAGRLRSEVFFNSSSFTFIILWIAGVVLITGIITSLLCSIYIVGFVHRHFREEREQNLKEKVARNQLEFMTLIKREVRDPIDTVTILSDRIMDEETSPTVRVNVLGIREACNSMLTSFNTIREYSTLETGDVSINEEEYEITKIVSECCEKVSPGVERKNLGFNVDYDMTMPCFLKGDQAKIRQILDNLLDNAVKYTYDGTVDLNVGYRVITPDKIDVTFTIKDSGVGIRQEEARKLFSSIGKMGVDKNLSIKGTGLGLLICKRLVGIMDGRISVESEIGKGSTFRFTVPQDVISRKTVGECIDNDI